MIEARMLSRRFDDILAVDEMQFAVEPGEIVGMVGVNGAGKTTCLRMLAGILPATSGTISIAGHLMTGESTAARRQLAFVPDTPMLFDALTTLEHLLFVAELYHVPDAAQRIDGLLDEFELEARRHHTASSLSRGMRQKLAICCAFLHEPAALLLDEPLTGLDPPGRRRMNDAITQRARDGCAVIVSSHQLEFVERLSTRFLIVHQGIIRRQGTLEQIREQIQLIAPEGTDLANLEDVFLYAIGRQPEPTPEHFPSPTPGDAP
jgi:ABC-2 type transport system ATP-binding protein